MDVDESVRHRQLVRASEHDHRLADAILTPEARRPEASSALGDLRQHVEAFRVGKRRSSHPRAAPGAVIAGRQCQGEHQRHARLRLLEVGELVPRRASGLDGLVLGGAVRREDTAVRGHRIADGLAIAKLAPSLEGAQCHV